jgi:hypothetical protein
LDKSGTIPAIRSALERKMKAESSAYSTALWCNGAPFLVVCLFKKPSDLEGKYLRLGVFICMVDHLVFMVLTAACRTKRIRMGARLSPCLLLIVIKREKTVMLPDSSQCNSSPDETKKTTNYPQVPQVPNTSGKQRPYHPTMSSTSSTSTMGYFPHILRT